MMNPVPESVSAAPPRKTVVVIGNGMVGLRFCEKLVEFDKAGEYRIVTFCEEPRAAYDRVGLTSFFAHRDAEKLMLAKLDWYASHGVELHLGDRADVIDRERNQVMSQKGVVIPYDHLVLATGSIPFVPPMQGVEKAGVFVYRTIEDLERIIAYSKDAKRCAVLGGGLLGLEAAKAVYDLLSKRARENLAARAQRYSAATGKTIAPEAMIVPSRFQLRFEPQRYVAQIVGVHALVEVSGLLPGDRAEVPCIYEDTAWRVDLVLPPLPPVQKRPGSEP